MDILELDQELRSDQIRPCYWLAGDERHLILTAKRHILKAIFKDQAPAVDLFSAKQNRLANILDSFRTASLFSSWRCLVVEEAEALKKKEMEDLEQALANSPAKAVLILISEKAPPAAVKKNLGAVAVVECKKLYPRQIAGWLNMEAKDLGVPISREAAGLLIDCVGPDLGSLRQSLEMLSLYVGQRKIIETEDVETVAARTVQKNIFELTNALGEKNPINATRMLEMILDQGEEPVRVLGMISRHLRLLASAQELLSTAGGKIPSDFAQRLGVHPFFAKDYVGQAKKWPSKKWKHCFDALLQCDVALKSSRHPRISVLEKLVWKLCRLG